MLTFLLSSGENETTLKFNTQFSTVMLTIIDKYSKIK